MVTSPEPYAGDTKGSPVAWCSSLALACAFIAIGIVTSYLPREAPLAWALGFLIVSGVLTLGAVVSLSRRRGFAWRLFFNVARWVFLVTMVFTAMGIYIMVYDQVKGAMLAVISAVMLLAAVNVPILIAFCVARHERVAQ